MPTRTSALTAFLALLLAIGVGFGLAALGLSSAAALIVGVVLLGAVVFVVDALYIRSARQAWQRLAVEAGLTYNRKGGPGIPDIGSVSGTYRGRQAMVCLDSSYPAYEGGTPEVATRFRVDLWQPVEGELEISLDRRAGGREVAFEKAVTLSGQPESFAHAVVASPSLRRRLLCLRRGSTLRLRHGWVALRQSAAHGMERDVAHMLSVLDALCELAENAEQL